MKPLFNYFTGLVCALSALIALAATGHAGVTVVQNVSPGATNWLGSPVISTMANPFSTAPARFYRIQIGP
jgi:hypothetical protein